MEFKSLHLRLSKLNHEFLLSKSKKDERTMTSIIKRAIETFYKEELEEFIKEHPELLEDV